MLVETLIQVQGPLFEAVQTAHIFKDDKTFVDSIPKKDPESILKEFEKLKKNKDFDLKNFVTKNFYLPKEKELTSVKKNDVKTYIEDTWNVLAKNFSEQEKYSTLIPLPFSHVVPGGRFREMYYWDSYFTIEGLVVSHRFDLIEAITKNLAYLIDHFGFVPNGNRFYYLTRSQQPYFSLIVDLLHREGRQELALSFYPQLLREYYFWMKGDKLLSEENNTHARVVLLNNGQILNRYFDQANHPREEAYSKDLACFEKARKEYKQYFYQNVRASCESGWDFSSRFMKDPNDLASIATLDYIPIDLNCLLYHHELILAKFADILDKEEEHKTFSEAASTRKSAILSYFWDEKRKFFFDYHYKEERCSNVFSLAAVFPLFFEICEEKEAKIVKEVLEKNFLKKGGLITTLTKSSQQWDGNNVWAPLQMIAYMGLKNYGFDELAKEVASRFVSMCQKVYSQTHTLSEKYNGESCSIDTQNGEYELQNGFGWTNAAVKFFLEELKK